MVQCVYGFSVYFCFIYVPCYFDYCNATAFDICAYKRLLIYCLHGRKYV